jgi:hypothetical protein
MAQPKLAILVLGGAGFQNCTVVKELSKNKDFSIRLMSRDVNSKECQELSAIPGVTLIEGNCYDDDTLISAFHGVNACYVNTNGFAIGEKAEIYWGIRIYEIAYWVGVKHFIYSSLPYVSKKAGFNSKYRVPFVDAKGKVVGVYQCLISFFGNSVPANSPFVLRLSQISAYRRHEVECRRERPVYRLTSGVSVGSSC